MSQPENQNPTAPPPWAQSAASTSPTKSWWQEPKTLLPLLLLVAVLAVVVFWLPSQIAPPAVNGAQTAQLSAPAASGGQQPALELPWTEAQLSKQRREAQDILARLLDEQKALEDAAVEQWAAEAYQQALATATAGDELYRQRQFDAAKAQYLAAEQQLAAIIARKPQVVAEQMAIGMKALADHDPEASVSALATVVAIEPDNNEAASALARAQVLEQVLALVKEADQAITLKDLALASEKLTAAAELDSQSELVSQRQAELASLQQQQSFAQRMSSGYSALQANQYQAAIKAFQSALALQPQAADAQSALTQARNAANQSEINNHLAKAQANAREEDWAQAVAEYDLALKQDPTLVATKVDRIKANARLQLDTSMTTLLKDPIRLADNQVYQSAQQTLADAKSLASEGSKLADQVEQLERAMVVAQTPITVTIKSDNQTLVTLYRVKQLGTFEQQSLALKPGQYVLVGSRAGYRDVRKEFTVAVDQAEQIIQIQCNEPVASG